MKKILRSFADYARRWVGITHRHRSKAELKKWARTKCRKGRHLLDECLSSGGEPFHCLHCDACGLTIIIEGVTNTYVTDPVVKKQTQKAHDSSKEHRKRLGIVYDLEDKE